MYRGAEIQNKEAKQNNDEANKTRTYHFRNPKGVGGGGGGGCVCAKLNLRELLS